MKRSRMQPQFRHRTHHLVHALTVALMLATASGCVATDETDLVLDEQESALESDVGRCIAARLNRPVSDCVTNAVDLVDGVTMQYCGNSAQALLNTLSSSTVEEICEAVWFPDPPPPNSFLWLATCWEDPATEERVPVGSGFRICK